MDLFLFACQFTCRRTADASDNAGSHILPSVTLEAAHGQIYAHTYRSVCWNANDGDFKLRKA